jgi:hypothetical protein
VSQQPFKGFCFRVTDQSREAFPPSQKGRLDKPSQPPLMITNLNVIRNCQAIPGRVLNPAGVIRGLMRFALFHLFDPELGLLSRPPYGDLAAGHDLQGTGIPQCGEVNVDREENADQDEADVVDDDRPDHNRLMVRHEPDTGPREDDAETEYEEAEIEGLLSGVQLVHGRGLLFPEFAQITPCRETPLDVVITEGDALLQPVAKA